MKKEKRGKREEEEEKGVENEAKLSLSEKL